MISKISIWYVFLVILPVQALAETSLPMSAAELGQAGISNYEAGNLIMGMDQLRESAELGYKPAQTKLGYILDQAEENEEAVKWLRLAADANDAGGQLGLAKMYAKGEGVEKNNDLAIEWLKRAVAQNYPAAMSIYGHALERGEMGLKPDHEKALQLFQIAADQNDNVAITRLIRAYRKGELGLAPSAELAAQWEKKLNEKKP